MDWNKLLDDARTWVAGGALTGIGGLWLRFRSERSKSQQVNFEMIMVRLETERARLTSENHECDELLLEAQKIIQHLNEAATRAGVKMFLLNRTRLEAFEELEVALERLKSQPTGCLICAECEMHIRRAVKNLKEDVVIPASGENQ